MPTVTRWVLRTALLWVALGMGIGVLMVWPGAPSLPYPTYLHVLTIGWLTNLIFGVAHWMFPRASAERPRGDERLAWCGAIALNIGLVMRMIGEMHGGRIWLLASAVVQLLAVWIWVAHLWTRVKVR